MDNKKIIIDGKEVSENELKEINKNPKVKLKLNEDGTYTTLQRLND